MVSIIVPLYNASQYIVTCYANVVEQTYTEWELIFINDGSSDNSASLLEELAKKDSRIRIIHQQKAGPGMARNAGLSIAKGKWVYFCDADDKISPNLLQRCVEQAEKNDADIVTFGFESYFRQSKEHIYSEFVGCTMHTNREIGMHWPAFMRQSVMGNGFSWNKLYCRSFLMDSNAKFGTERIMEDELFNLRLLRRANSMVVMNDIFYTYYCDNPGNSRQQYVANRLEIVTDVRNEMLRCVEYWNLNDAWLNEYIDQRYWTSIKLCLLEDHYHPHNTLPFSRKRKRVLEICANASVRNCIRNLMQEKFGLKDKLYATFILNKSFLALSAWGMAFNVVRRIRKGR